jgi:hypothetical protein
MRIKIEFVAESRLLYPTLYNIQKRLEAALDYRGSRAKARRVDEHLADLLYNHYMQELQTRS